MDQSAIVIRPKQPFIDWVNSTAGPTYEECGEDFNVYLVSGFEDEGDENRQLRKHYLEIFENELAAYYQDESRWPKPRDFKTFQAWFSVSFHSLVFDLTT